MAKAEFHKNQRVYVGPVGTWAVIEQIKPHWVKDVPEPLRISYEVGLGRDFTANELSREAKDHSVTSSVQENWRIQRAKNKWQTTEECADHPFPGTFPVVVTDANDWGGWRTPGAEYDRDPAKIEFQARIIASSLRLLEIAKRLDQQIAASAENAPAEMVQLAKEARQVIRFVEDLPASG
ncbi:FIG00483637: hypothetical protein [hydrothermal vent metagenome]|uniref:Uncharacterized protein n=1 Tax=hydrothermal vent metagenome TaxID=652676 RepID=A0A3B0SRA1_9ZZZZ